MRNIILSFLTFLLLPQVVQGQRGCKQYVVVSLYRSFFFTLLCSNTDPTQAAGDIALLWSTSSSSDLGLPSAVSRPFSSLLLTLSFYAVFMPCFSNVFMEVPSAWLMCSAVFCGGSVWADWTWLYLAWGSPRPPHTEPTPAAPLATTLPSKPKMSVAKCYEKTLKVFVFSLNESWKVL